MVALAFSAGFISACVGIIFGAALAKVTREWNNEKKEIES